MLQSLFLSPLPHGSVGILDEVLLYCLPLAAAIIILAIASRRARRHEQPRERTRSTDDAPKP